MDPGRLEGLVSEIEAESSGDHFEQLARKTAAAQRLAKEAAAGADLGPFVPRLLEAWRDVTDVGLLDPLADSLAHQLLRMPGGADRLARLVSEAIYVYGVLGAIGRADASGVDVREILPALVAESRRPDRGLAIRSFLASWAARRPGRFAELATLLGDRSAGLFVGVVEEVALWRRGDIAEALPALARLLASRSAPVREAAAGAFRLAVEGGADASPFVPALERALRSKVADVRNRSAYAIAWQAVERRAPSDWGAVDRLLAHRDRSVREGALWALGVLLGGRGRDEPELVLRVALRLEDGEAELRRRAADTLREAARRGRSLRLPGAVLAELVRAGTPEAAEFLASSSPDRRVCSICRHIPRALAESHESGIPPEARRLDPPLPVEVAGERQARCPECGARYLFSYEVEYDVNSESRQYSLSRLPPAGPLGEPGFERRLGDLDHPDPWQRRESAWILAHDLRTRGDAAGIERILLAHADDGVRDEALQLLPGDLDLDPIVPAIRRLLEDPAPAVRNASARALGRWFASRARWDEFRSLLGLGSGPAVASALYALHGVSERTDLSPLAFALRRCLRHEHERVRTVARWLLARFPDPSGATLVAALGALGDATSEIRRDGASVLLDLAVAGAGLEPAQPALLANLGDEGAGWHAIGAIHAAVGRGLDPERVLPALGEVIRADRCPNLDETWSLLREAIRRRRGVEDVVATLIHLAGDARRRQSAISFLQDVAREGLDVSAARRVLERASAGDADGFTREQATKALVREHLRAGRWPPVVHLLSEGRHDARGAAASVLAEVAGSTSLSPAVAALAANVPGSRGFLRDGMLRALRAHADRGPDESEEVRAALARVGITGLGSLLGGEGASGVSGSGP